MDRLWHRSLEETTGHPWRPLDVRHAGIGLLDLTAVLLDPASWSYWRKHPSVAVPVPADPEPTPPPVPRPYPIKLDVDHDREIASNLRLLEDELRWVKRRPSSWRWVIVALYNALGHALAKHRPANYVDDSRLGQLLRLFDAVVNTRPEIACAREAVAEVERLRTTWITRSVTTWLVTPPKLSDLVEELTRTASLLAGDSGPGCGTRGGKAGGSGG